MYIKALANNVFVRNKERKDSATTGVTDGGGLLHALEAPNTLTIRLLASNVLGISDPDWIWELTRPSKLDGDWPGFVANHTARSGLPLERATRLAYEAAIVGMQDLLPHKDGVCAGCGRPVEPPSDAILGDGALIHYGGAHGQRCWRDHQVKARGRAVRTLAELGLEGPEE